MSKPTKLDLDLLKEKYPNNFDEILNKVEEGYPIQYLIGDVNFYGYDIKVNENVLIPRFETELLLEKTINLIKENNIQNPSILDIGTGSGCISIVLKKEVDNSKVTAIDISNKALEVAEQNAKFNEVNINFIEKDILNETIEGNYDLIISNPPYLTEDDEVSYETKYEPQNALFANDKGLEFYKRIIDLSIGHLNKGGIIAFETGEHQHSAIKEYIETKYTNGKIILEKDYNDRERFVFFINE